MSHFGDIRSDDRSCASASRGNAMTLRHATAPTFVPASSDRALNVLMVGPGLHVKGGVSSVERLILSALPAHVNTKHVVTMVDGSKVRKLWTFARAVREYSAHLRCHPDVVHIHFSARASSVRKELLARLALARGMKVIMHAHAGEYRLYWNSLSDSARARTLAIFSQISALIVLGEGWRKFFSSIGVPEEKIVVLPNPVHLPEQLPVRPPSQVVTCVYLGAILPKKGTFDLLSATALLPPNIRSCVRMIFAGNGQGAALREKAQALNLSEQVVIHEWLDARERDALLVSADVFALPSYNEGLPMSLLEAMAFGVAPIATPVGGIPEVVQHGISGLLVPPGDVDALANALRHLVENYEERIAMGLQARAAVQPLSLDLYIQGLCRLYAAIAGRTDVADADRGARRRSA